MICRMKLETRVSPSRKMEGWWRAMWNGSVTYCTGLRACILSISYRRRVPVEEYSRTKIGSFATVAPCLNWSEGQVVRGGDPPPVESLVGSTTVSVDSKHQVVTAKPVVTPVVAVASSLDEIPVVRARLDHSWLVKSASAADVCLVYCRPHAERADVRRLLHSLTRIDRYKRERIGGSRVGCARPSTPAAHLIRLSPTSCVRRAGSPCIRRLRRRSTGCVVLLRRDSTVNVDRTRNERG
nr:hypothetical protein CFP56_13323 [Quercus suber]